MDEPPTKRPRGRPRKIRPEDMPITPAMKGVQIAAGGKIKPGDEAEKLSEKIKKRRPGKPAKTRADVWHELARFNFNPIRNLVEMALDDAVSEKTKKDINLELLSYIAPKCKQTIEVESNGNPLADLLAIVAQAGRPPPPTAIEAVAIVVGEDGDED